MNEIIKAILHFSLILFIQTLLLQNLEFGLLNTYVVIFIFPTIVLIMPFDWPSWLGLLVAFILGLCADMFYDSPGVFAASGVFSAFIRPLVLSLNEPRTGYGREVSPVISSMGWIWFLRYSTILLFAFTIIYFWASSPQWSKLGIIILQSIISVPISMIFVVFYVMVFNPRL